MILTLSTQHVLGLPLQEIWFGLIFFILGMFVFLDGFDFGAGVIFAFEDHEAQEKLQPRPRSGTDALRLARDGLNPF